MQVWKFSLSKEYGVNEIEIPKDAIILHFDCQYIGIKPYFKLWALVRTKARKEKRRF